MIEKNEDDAHPKALDRMLAIALREDLPIAVQVYMLGMAWRSDEEGCVWLDDQGMPITPEWMKE